MKVLSPLIFAASAAAFDIDLDSEQQLVRVKRQSPDGFECIFRELDGSELYFSDYSEAECKEMKDAIFWNECSQDLCGPDENGLTRWDCNSHEDIDACVLAQYMQGRKGGPGNGGRKLGVKYTRWKAVAKIIAHVVAKPTLRKKDVIKKMLNYGCHCFPGSKKNRSVGGKGPAMDELDGVCRSQYQCHKCVSMDLGCDPDRTPYKVQFKGRKGALQKEIICRDEEGTCGRAMCECDKNMAENLDTVFFKENAHNGFYWLDKKNKKRNPVFDYEGTCLTPGASPQPDTCCGNFPDVVPYNAATKDCCVMTDGPKLFDPMTHTCCAGGLIATAGSC